MQSALMDLHRAGSGEGDGGGEVEFQGYGEVEIVSTFGVPQAEYAAIRKACGLMDLAQRGVLEVGGKDRASFLNNFLTNLTWNKDTKTAMAAGTGVYAFLLNGKGRVVADMNVLETGESIFLETDARLVPLLKASLEKFVFTEKVTFADRCGEWSVMAVHGPGASAVLGGGAAELGVLANKRLSVAGVEALMFRDDPCGVPGYFLVVPRGEAEKVWRGLSEPYAGQTNKRTLRPVGWAMFNATRIEAGRPIYGIDFTDQSLPAETGVFERAVSVVKGCYLGQEIVARMYARNVVAKQLVGVRMLADALPTAGAEVMDAVGGEGNIVGIVTSSTLSPVLGGAAIALATVKKGFTAVETKLRIPAESAVREAEVVALPFVKG